MPSEIFRIDWYPQKAFIGFSHLKAEQIGVLMQIINLIYIRNGPIANDEQYIGKSCNIIKSKARKLVNELLDLGEIYLTAEGKISHRVCDYALSETRIRMENYAKNGEKGAKKRWGAKEKQVVTNEGSIQTGLANTNINEENQKRTVSQTDFRRLL